jgi:hypothetical protein
MPLGKTNTRMLTGDEFDRWEETYTTVSGNSASWASGGGDALVANSLDQFADVTQTGGAALAINASTTLAGGNHSGNNTGDQDLSGYALTSHGHSVTGIFGITIDGAGSAITTGTKGYLYVPYACTITVAELVADVSGSIVIDVWKDTAANFPPTDADSITASAPPTLSSAQRSSDSTLTGWTVSLAAGDYLGFNVDSAATVTRVTLALKVTRTI